VVRVMNLYRIAARILHCKEGLLKQPEELLAQFQLLVVAKYTCSINNNYIIYVSYV